MRTLFFKLALGLSTLFFSLLAVAGGLARANKKWFDWVHRNWSRSVLAAAGARIRLEGAEHTDPEAALIYMSNHQSGFDIWAILAALPGSIRFVTKQELAQIPIFSSACRAAGHVFIDRTNPATAGEEIRVAGARMRSEGLSLMVFPEGSRMPSGDMRRFKKGAFTLALEIGVPLVPVAITGGADIMANNGGRVRPGTIRVRCGRPIPLAGLGQEERDRLMASTRELIEAMLREMTVVEGQDGQTAVAPAPDRPAVDG